MEGSDPLAWPAATSGWRRLAVSGIGGSPRAGLGLCATEPYDRPEGASARPTRGGSSRMNGIGYPDVLL